MLQVQHLMMLFIAVSFLSTSVANDSSCSVNNGFTSGPMTIIVTPSEILNTTLLCDIPNFPPNGIIWNHFLNGKELHRVATNFFIPNGASYSFSYSEGTLTLLNSSVLYHGEYYCNLQNPCTDVISPSGYVNVISPILMMLQEDTENSTVSTEGGHPIVYVTKPLYIPMHMFGYPPPELTLLKQREAINGVDEGFDVVTSSHVTINTSGVSFDAVEFTDEGYYELRAHNSEGNTSINFTITVLGVLTPDVSLSSVNVTPSSYGDQPEPSMISCSVPRFAFDSDSGDLSITWKHNDVSITTQSTQNIYQFPFNKTTQLLVIQSIEVADNGLYLCEAENQLGDRSQYLRIIGPPEPVEIKTVSNTFLIWDPPEAYGAAIANYTILYKYGNDERTFIENKREHEIPELCPPGDWSVTVTAINQYGGVGQPASTVLTVTENHCSMTNRSPTTEATPSSSSSTTITSTSRSTSTIVESSSSIRPSFGATSSSSTSLPIAAGAAAGAFVLIILVSVLVFAIACYITVSKRGSNSRAEQQWVVSQNRPSANNYGEHVDNGYVKSNNMDGKSPDSQMNAYEMGLPSPIPANPGYGPIYIDPRFEFPRENLDFTDILYDGAFTVIYKARAKGINENKPIDVAVKQLKDDFLDFDDYSSALIMEMEQLAQLEPHPNIVGLIRVCSVTRPVLMIMEYMCHGDLLGFLRTTRGHTDMYTVNPGTKNLPTQLKLTSRDLLSIIRQVATGMQFLSEQKIVHGALCARNVLVTTSMEVRIFNIGIHNLDNDETLESLVRWMAPEVFVDNVRTSYGDIWSFGVLMWEVVTLGGTPYSETGTEDLYTQLMSGTRLQKPVHCAQPVYDVMSMCWESIPQHRPMFFEINDHLENMNLSKMSYLDLRNYNDTAYSQFEESERQQTSIL